MNTALKSPAQIREEAAERLSYYEGDSNSYEGGDPNQYEGGDETNYTGIGDDSIDFCGGNSFMSEGGSQVQFSFTLTNAAAANKVIALTPTYLGSAANIATNTGETVDGVLTDGTIITSVTATAANSKLTIAGLQNFFLYNPSRLIRMTVKSNTEDGFLASELAYGQANSFRTSLMNRLAMTNFVGTDQETQKKAVIDFRAAGVYNMQLDSQNIILLRVSGTNIVATTGEVLNVTMEFGAIKNPARELSQKAIKAYKTRDRMVAAGVIKTSAPTRR